MFLDISPEKAMERGGYGDERYEKEAMQREVRRIFSVLGKQVSDNGGHWVVVDAGRDKDTVAADLWQHVSTLPDEISSPIGQLWMEKLVDG
jgi:dTMP kinase